MGRYLLIGLLCFLLFAVVFAPAGLIPRLAAGVPGLQMHNAAGTVWRGSADVLIEGQDLGRAAWQVRPAGLLRARLSLDVQLQATGETVEARIERRLRGTEGTLRGRVDMRHFAPLLQNYDLEIPGAIDISELSFRHRDTDPLPYLHGELSWTGGNVRYVLGNDPHQTQLPPLVGQITTESDIPTLNVTAEASDTPLMRASIAPDGWATIGISRRFTELVGQPWQSDAPPQAMVLEVQEKLF
jgi:hypothetical protein